MVLIWGGLIHNAKVSFGLTNLHLKKIQEIMEAVSRDRPECYQDKIQKCL